MTSNRRFTAAVLGSWKLADQTDPEFFNPSLLPLRRYPVPPLPMEFRGQIPLGTFIALGTVYCDQATFAIWQRIVPLEQHKLLNYLTTTENPESGQPFLQLIDYGSRLSPSDLVAIRRGVSTGVERIRSETKRHGRRGLHYRTVAPWQTWSSRYYDDVKGRPDAAALLEEDGLVRRGELERIAQHEVSPLEEEFLRRDLFDFLLCEVVRQNLEVEFHEPWFGYENLLLSGNGPSAQSVFKRIGEVYFPDVDFEGDADKAIRFLQDDVDVKSMRQILVEYSDRDDDADSANLFDELLHVSRKGFSSKARAYTRAVLKTGKEFLLPLSPPTARERRLTDQSLFLRDFGRRYSRDDIPTRTADLERSSRR